MIPMVFALLLLLASAAAAEATLIFDWTGHCLTGCTGEATLHIAVSDNYVPGTFGGGDGTALLAATYTDSVGPPFSLEAFAAHDLFTLFVPTTPGGVSSYSDQTDSFRTFADGTWRFETEHHLGPCTLPDCGHTATGFGSLWVAGAPTTVPGSATLVLLGLGGALAALVGRRRAAHRRGSRPGSTRPA